jgi:SPP1 gp7 family putative phage head morphogenesis protein
VTAVFGPPWRAVSDPSLLLQIDPPVLLARRAKAAVHLDRNILVRKDSPGAVRKAALKMSSDVGGPVEIFEGAIQTTSGGWLWANKTDVVHVLKADDDPLTRSGHARAVQQLRDDLLEFAVAGEMAASATAANILNLNWAALAPEAIEEAIMRAATVVASVPLDATFASAARAALGNMTTRVAGLALRAAPGLGVNAVLTADQTGLARRIGSSAMVFITDEFGRRSTALSNDARRIIAHGVARGLGREDIGRDLRQAFGHRLSGRDEWYFQVVSSTAVSRARSYGQMVGYRRAGIDFYMWEALNDERTCEICRFLHGQQFPVGSALQAFNRALRNPDPEAAVNEFAWYRVVGGERLDDGLRRGGDIHVQPRRGPLGPLVASTLTSGVGQRDVVGTHRVHTAPRAAGGTVVPPAHGMCRCTTVPV